MNWDILGSQRYIAVGTGTAGMLRISWPPLMPVMRSPKGNAGLKYVYEGNLHK